MKIAFGMIVFNSDFVLKQVLETIYPYAEQILIAEGPVKYWADKGYTTSTDKTNQILESFPDPDNKLTIVRGPYPEKDDMCNAYIKHMNDDIDYIWHIDADEVYKPKDIEKIIELMEKGNYTSAGFRCYSFYGGVDNYITGFEEESEFHRLFKVYPGTTWLTHRPPTVKHAEGVETLPEKHLSFETLDKEHGIRIHHYSYVFPRQVYEKMEYYRAAVSLSNCRNNYFEEVYMPWVLSDAEGKKKIEDTNDGVHEFINRTSSFTSEFVEDHPPVMLKYLGELETEFKNQLKTYYYKITNRTIPKLTSIGNVSWDNNDLIQKLDEFADLYQNKPIEENQGGMKAAQMFPAWYIIQKMKFPYIIESGVWYGQGTWCFEKASPDSKIFALDINLQQIKWKSPKAEYFSTDFFNIDWNRIQSDSRIDKKNTLLFFDDHQDAMARMKYAVDNGWKYLMFEDNYPTGQGDCVSLKKTFDEDGEDAKWLKKVIKTYYEFPPIVKVDNTRWGDEWDDVDYPTPKPLLKVIEDDKRKVYLEEIEQYTWICFVELEDNI